MRNNGIRGRVYLRSRSKKAKRTADARWQARYRERQIFLNNLYANQNYEKDREKFMTMATYVMRAYDLFQGPPPNTEITSKLALQRQMGDR